VSSSAVVCEFLSVRNRQVYLLLGGVGALFFSILILHAGLDNSPHYHRESAIIIFAFGLVFCLLLGIRALRIARIQLTETELIYRSAVRSHRFAKADIATAELQTGTRLPSPRKWAQPVIELRTGKRVVLADFSTQPGSGLYEIRAIFYEPGTKEIEMETLEELISELNDWMSVNVTSSIIAPQES
jgi:hypothetical protein